MIEGDEMRRIRWQDVLRGVIAPLGLTAAVAQAGGPLPYSDEWYQMRADDPPGARQVEKKGKLWPPYPRPVGRKQTFWHGYHSAHYWPYPYNCEDQAYVRNLLDQQTAAGWVNATTMHDYYFNAETQQLNEAGQNHLLWITASVPAQYRTIYVAQGKSTEMGQLRSAHVDEFLRGAGIENVPPVLTKQDFFAGRPANEVDRLRMLELQSIPRPRLFIIGANSRSGASSGAGASQGQGGGGSGSGSGSGTGGMPGR